MGRCGYTEMDWRPVDPMLKTMPIADIVPHVKMSEFALRDRCRKIGVKPITPPRKRKLKTKELDRLIRSFGGGVYRV